MKKIEIPKFEIKLASINNKFAIFRGRKILTKPYREFKKALEEELSIYSPLEPLEGRIKTRLEFWMYKDVDACLKPVHDCLEDLGYIKNDRYIEQTLIIKHTIKRGHQESMSVEVMEDNE